MFLEYNINRIYIKILYSKKYWVILTQFWVKYGQTQTLGAKCNLKM